MVVHVMFCLNVFASTCVVLLYIFCFELCNCVISICFNCFYFRCIAVFIFALFCCFVVCGVSLWVLLCCFVVTIYRHIIILFFYLDIYSLTWSANVLLLVDVMSISSHDTSVYFTDNRCKINRLIVELSRFVTMTNSLKLSN